MPRWKRVGLALVAVLGAAIAGFAVFVAARQDLRFDHEVPPLGASSDPAVIARGEYVVRKLASCGVCHGDPARLADSLKGDATVPFSGGRTWTIPPGSFRAYNITSDRETGIGGLRDAQLVRALRYGIGREGRVLLPFMEMQGLADDDLVAVISYLRTLPAVRNAVPPHEINLLGRIVKATLFAKPTGPKAPPPKVAPRGASVETGRYLVESVANCWACHTERDLKTGEMVGPHLAGGHLEDEFEPTKRSWNAPNLTSDPKTGRTGQLTEEQFLLRMKAGRAYEASPMPWNNFAGLDDDDLRAIYRYLRTVPRVTREAGPPVVELTRP